MIDPRQIVGHRGSALEAPENTLGGFEHLKQHNIHRVELDVQLTRDNQLVVFHDENLSRTCGVPNILSECTYEELQSYNAAAHFHQWPANETIPTLHQVLSNWPELEEIQVEVKPNTHQASNRTTLQRYVSIVVAEIEAVAQELKLTNEVIISSKFKEVLEYSKRTYAHLRSGFVYESEYQLSAGRSPVETAETLGCSHLIPLHKMITPQLAEAAHARSLTLSTWTVNQPELALQLINEYGVHTVITDRVGLFTGHSAHPLNQ